MGMSFFVKLTYLVNLKMLTPSSAEILKQEKSPKKKPHRSKSREDPNRPLPVADILENKSDDDCENLEFVSEQVSTLHLQEFDSSLDKRKKKKSKNNKGAGIKKD